MEIKLKENERIDDLEFKNLKIIQNKDGFCFGIDSILLTDFAKNIKQNSKVIDLDKSNTIPEFTYLMNQIEEFPKIENPKMSDYKQIAYLENEDTDDTIENRMHSVFNIGKTNFDNLLCKKESFILHSPTFLFFKLGNFLKTLR